MVWLQEFLNSYDPKILIFQFMISKSKLKFQFWVTQCSKQISNLSDWYHIVCLTTNYILKSKIFKNITKNKEASNYLIPNQPDIFENYKSNKLEPQLEKSFDLFMSYFRFLGCGESIKS